jgi:hypothetical protein
MQGYFYGHRLPLVQQPLMSNFYYSPLVLESLHYNLRFLTAMQQSLLISLLQ